jgi:hypothetical protein
MKKFRLPTSLLFIIIISACAVNKDYYLHQQSLVPPSELNDVAHTIYFLGGSDEVKLEKSIIGQLLAGQMEASGKESTLLLLGNNSLRKTTNDPDSSKKAIEHRNLLERRYDFFNGLKGTYYGVMGPHEWANGTKKGMESVRILEEIVEDELGQGNIIKPAFGCPGPEEIEIGENVVLLLIDTQWLFHDWEKPKTEDGCGAETNLDFYVNLDDAIKRNNSKTIIVAGYHSLEGNAKHGGYFPAKSHLIPLPVLGSMNVLYRSWIGGGQDLANPKYKNFVSTMRDILKIHENIIYMSAHEKTLEYHYDESIHSINSGSYSKGQDVAQKNAVFASGKRGFGRLLFSNNGACYLQYWGLNVDQPELLYQKMLFQGLPTKSPDKLIPVENIDYSDSVITTFASDLYSKKRKRAGMLGTNYRKEWVTEVPDIPYFDIGSELGGLEILKRGGGQQTKSLRLESKDKKHYVLRSVEKYPESAVPAELRNTVAVDIVYDQISAAHPYGAFVIPSMAEAAGIYHTNPKLFYLPDDPRLGIYRHTFGNGLYLFEERPAKNREDIESFGRSKDIVNTFEVLKETRKDGDHYVDQEFVLRSRLFDMLIGDWDRHDDQWRWATFKDEMGDSFYRPIPRDRDNAFFWSDGWLLKIASLNWGIAKFQGFHDEIRDINGLSFNGRFFDRSFVNEPSKETWIAIAKDLQIRMTDDVIEKAIGDFPKDIFELHGEEIIRKLKNRRNDLVSYATTYYAFLSTEVNILGSDKNEHFVVERINDDETRVVVYLLKSKSDEVKRKMYERTFHRSETGEIRLYGFNGEDKFDIDGDVSKSIKIRIVGGKGHDIINDQSNVSGMSKQTLLYDKKSNTIISSAGEVRDFTSDKDPLINDYNRKQFQFGMPTPLIYPGYNPDDGLFIGVGVMFRTFGFRKYPFKSKHIIKADLAPRSKSYDFSYAGTFTELVGKWDLKINANIYAPSYTDYFYGYGNETEFDKEKFNVDSRYYSARYIQYIFYPELMRTSKNELHHYLIGGGYQSVNVKSSLNDLNQEQDRFIITFDESLPYDLLDVQRHYVALYGSYTFDNTDSEHLPLEGIKWQVYLLGLEDVDDKEMDVNFQRVRTDVSYYYTFGRFLKTTLALRAGGTLTNGEFEFYHAAKFGGTNTFRGVRKFRLSGSHNFYQNTDLRIKLFNIRNPVLPTTVGMVLFHDFGRVWMEDDPSTTSGESDKMHRAWGAGIWMAPLSKISFGLDYSRSTLDEDALFLRMGFFF